MGLGVKPIVKLVLELLIDGVGMVPEVITNLHDSITLYNKRKMLERGLGHINQVIRPVYQLPLQLRQAWHLFSPLVHPSGCSL